MYLKENKSHSRMRAFNDEVDVSKDYNEETTNRRRKKYL